MTPAAAFAQSATAPAFSRAFLPAGLTTVEIIFRDQIIPQ
jgi:hypothetical protein